MLERPLIYLVPAIAAALFCAVCLDWAPSPMVSLLLLAVFLLLAGIFIYRNKAFALFGMLAAAHLAFCGFSIYNLYIVEPIRHLNGQSLDIQAVLLEDPDVYEDSQRALLSVTHNGEVEQTFRTFCYLPLTDTPLYAGDHIVVNVGFYLPGTAEGFDRAVYQASNRCFIASSYNQTEVDTPVRFEMTGTERDTPRFLPQRIARYCKQAIAGALPERPAGLLTALLLGDKSGISDADALALRIAGLSHLVAVSGLHIGFLVAFCSLLGRRIGTLVSIPFILLFVPIAGASPSVIRAAVMYLVTAGAFLLRKEASSLNSLFLALALLLILNPYAIASLSLQLSFSATLGLILLAGKMQRRMMKPFRPFPKMVYRILSVVVGSVSCTVCATIFTTPIILSAFGYVSVLSLLSNLLVVGVTAVCFIGGFLVCLTSVFFPFLATLFAKAITPLLTYILDICNWIAGLPFGLINWADSFGIAALVLSLAGILAWLLAGAHIKWRYVLPVFCLVLFGITASGAYYNRQHYSVTYLPCGSGQAIIVSDAVGNMTLIDCAGDGGYRNAAASVREWMQWNGFRQVDTLVLTAVDKGHARDLPELLQHTSVEQILIPNGCKETQHNKELLQLVAEADAEIVEDTVQLDAAAPVTVFPVCDGKLGVQIGGYVLVLHSPTQKQLAAFFETESYSAPDIVLSQRNMEDTVLLRQLISDTNAQRIILQSSTGDVLHKFEGTPIESPYFTGELQERYKKEG